MQQIVLASGNQKKLVELKQLVEPLGFGVLAQTELGVPDAVEDGLSFIENALIKARHCARITGLPALADDSGLAVDALGGAPGIYSARFAGEPSNDAANNALLLQKLAGVPVEARGAAFYCVLALVRHADDPVPVICQGQWRGRILEAPQGEHGFGYDPLFWVESEQCSSAELLAARKNAISHRGLAMQQLRVQLEHWR